MKKVFIATNNAGKIKDFESLFHPLGIEVLSIKDLDETIEVEETGTTFEENARLKAEEVAQLLNMTVISDDSGLEIDALSGAPGVYSARYAGINSTDDENIDKVLKELQQTSDENRTARFVCVLAVARPNKETLFFKGTCEGKITSKRHGTLGFGYDPIFFVPSKQRTMAELSASEKSSISHRGHALRKLQDILPSIV